MEMTLRPNTTSLHCTNDKRKSSKIILQPWFLGHLLVHHLEAAGLLVPLRAALLLVGRVNRLERRMTAIVNQAPTNLKGKRKFSL